MYTQDMATSASQKITLAPDLERFVQSIVASGLYSSVNEAVQAGLRLLKEQESTLVPAAELREMITVGLEQADRNELVDGEEVFQELEKRFGVTLDAP